MNPQELARLEEKREYCPGCWPRTKFALYRTVYCADHSAKRNAELAAQEQQMCRIIGADPPTIHAGAAPNWNSIEEADLRDNSRLGQLYVQAVRLGEAPKPVCGSDPVLEFWALAEMALKRDRKGTPGALFRFLCKSLPESPQRRIPQEFEDRAQKRIDADARYDLRQQGRSNTIQRKTSATQPIEVFGDVAGPFGYLHATLMQCFLPQKRPPDGVRVWRKKHGHTSLEITAGDTLDPANEDALVQWPLPWGSPPRLLMPYIVGHAIVHNRPNIDLGPSLRSFLKKIGVTYGGPVGSEYVAQLRALLACEFRLLEWGEVPRDRKAFVSDDTIFWPECDDRQHRVWQPEIILSDRFFSVIQNHRVPVDISHLAQLRFSPRRMDLYLWLSYRNYLLRGKRPVEIRTGTLQELFAPDIAPENGALFRQRLKADIKKIKAIHPFKVSLKGNLLTLVHSKEPVAPKRIRRSTRTHNPQASLSANA